MNFDEYFKLKGVTLNITNGCNLNCVYCLSGDTRIIMSDLTTKAIKDINIGDKIVSFNEISEPNKQRKLVTSEVIKVFEPRYVEKLYHIKTENGNELYITDEHPIIDGRNKWTTSSKLFNKTERIIKTVSLPIYDKIDIIDEQYKIGYIISCFLGDGLIKKYQCADFKTKKKYDGVRIRFVVKDDEIINRLKQYLNDLNIDFNKRFFKISTKYNVIKEGIFSNTKNIYDILVDMIENNLNKNTNENYFRGFLAGIYDCEGSYGKDKQLKITQGRKDVIEQIKTALDYFGFKYTFKPNKTNINIQVWAFRILEKSINDFLMKIYPACNRKRIKYEGYSPISREQIVSIEEIDFNNYVYNIETTEHTYIANNVLVHNCFEHSKNAKHMSVDDAIKIYDRCYTNYLLGEYKEPFLVNFFGGEPFLNFPVMENVMKYAKDNDHKTEFGVTTNLTILDDHMIDVIDEYNLAMLVSVDGKKEIHDRNRCGTFDIVKNNVHRLREKGLGHLLEARMTIMPDDVKCLLDSVKTVFEMGFDFIAPVPVMDTLWTPEQIKEFRDVDETIWDWVISVFNDDSNKRNLQVKLVEDYLEQVLIAPINDYQRKVCTAGSLEFCSVGVEGDILPCHQRHTVKEGYEELLMGNVLKSDEIKVPEFSCKTFEGAFDCNDCIAYPICKGGCPSENYTYNGKSNRMNVIQCSLTMAMANVAINKQKEIMSCSNIRSRRLNALKTNLEVLNELMNVIASDDNEEVSKNLNEFYHRLMNMKDILIPTFSDAIETLVEHLVNNYKNS